MKKRLLICCLAMLVLLGGCARKASAPIGSQVWEEMPAITYGVMEYEKLEVLPWDSGRCEATSKEAMIETELGYYSAYNLGLIYYADKEALNNWVAVCNKAHCPHNDNTCSGYTTSLSIIAKNDRIYFTVLKDAAQELYAGGASFILASMKPDGTDRRFEFAFDEHVPHTPLASTALLTSQYWIYNTLEMEDDGTETARSYIVTANGAEEYPAAEDLENYRVGFRQIQNWGDRLYGNPVLSAETGIFHRYRNGKPEAVDLADLFVTFSYISGNTMRCFRANDGYYDVNIETREEIKLADPQLENSFASIILPNCIVETTLMYRLSENPDPAVAHSIHEMRLFDGKSWRTVELPNELLQLGGGYYFLLKSVTSDSVLFSLRVGSSNTLDYYRIDLTKENLKLEYAFQIIENANYGNVGE